MASFLFPNTLGVEWCGRLTLRVDIERGGRYAAIDPAALAAIERWS
jgi:hypothetical protein